MVVVVLWRTVGLRILVGFEWDELMVKCGF